MNSSEKRIENGKAMRQMMYSLYWCLYSEYELRTDVSIKLVQELYPYAYETLFKYLITNANQYDKSVTDFQRKVAKCLVVNRKKRLKHMV